MYVCMYVYIILLERSQLDTGKEYTFAIMFRCYTNKTNLHKNYIYFMITTHSILTEIAHVYFCFQLTIL